jgi:hypothetical protein
MWEDNFATCRVVRVTKIKGSSSDLLAPCLQVLLITIKYSAISDLHNFHFPVARALGFSVFTEQNTIGASLTLGDVILSHWSGGHRINDLHFSGRYQCLPIRCSGRLISLQNEHPIYSVDCEVIGARWISNDLEGNYSYLIRTLTQNSGQIWTIVVRVPIKIPTQHLLNRNLDVTPRPMSSVLTFIQQEMVWNFRIRGMP